MHDNLHLVELHVRITIIKIFYRQNTKSNYKQSTNYRNNTHTHKHYKLQHIMKTHKIFDPSLNTLSPSEIYKHNSQQVSQIKEATRASKGISPTKAPLLCAFLAGFHRVKTCFHSLARSKFDSGSQTLMHSSINEHPIVIAVGTFLAHVDGQYAALGILTRINLMQHI